MVSLTTAKVRKPRMTDEEKQVRAAEKKAAAHAEKLDSLVVLGRATFKATGAQLYAVQSGEKTYHVTRIAGRVRSCVDAVTGETCKARYYGADHCCHSEVVEMMEAKRSEELTSDMSAHVVDTLAAPADPWTDENYDPFAGMTVMQRREAYRALYPDDFAA